MKRYIMLFLAFIVIMMDVYNIRTGKVFFRYGVIYEDKNPQVFYYTILISFLAVIFCIYQFFKLKK